ncbi:MAG: pilus assembly protein TadG-related protein [Acidimicrobiales bacterium]
METRERGQATSLLAVVVLVAGLVALALARMGGDAVDRARAESAADAAALAGAAEGRVSASELADRNGAHLLSFTELGADVVVVVRVGDARARARARASGSVGPLNPESHR